MSFDPNSNNNSSGSDSNNPANSHRARSGTVSTHGPSQHRHQTEVTSQNRSSHAECPSRPQRNPSARRIGQPPERYWDDYDNNEYRKEEEEEEEEAGSTLATYDHHQPGEELWTEEILTNAQPTSTDARNHSAYVQTHRYGHENYPDPNYYDDHRSSDDYDSSGHQFTNEDVAFKRDNQISSADNMFPFFTSGGCISPGKAPISSLTRSQTSLRSYSPSAASDSIGFSGPSPRIGSSPLRPYSPPKSPALARLASSTHARVSSSPSKYSGDSNRERRTSAQSSPRSARVARLDTSVFTSVHPLQQSSSAFSPRPSLRLNSPRHLGYTSPHLALSSRDLFEGAFPMSDPAVDAQEESGSSSTSSATDSSSRAFKGRERALMQEQQEQRRNSAGHRPHYEDVVPHSRLMEMSAEERPAQTEIQIDTPMGSRRRADDLNGDNIVMLPTVPSDGLSYHAPFKDSKDEESDIERYSGLMKKLSRQMTSNSQHRDRGSSGGRHHQRYASCSADLECGNSSRTVIHTPHLEPRAHQSDILHSNEEARAHVHERDIGASPAQTLFSFDSIKSNMLSRLFGSHIASGGRANASRSPNLPVGSKNADDISEKGKEFNKGKSPASPGGSSTLAGPSFSRNDNHEEQAEDLTRNITSSRIQPSRSGGILSNLLKLQALSMPASSRQHRKRRHKQNHHRQRRTSRNPSIVPELGPGNGGKGGPSRNILSSPSATMLSLPGLLMTAPSGVGMTPQTEDGSSSSPQLGYSSGASTYFNTPMTDNGLCISTSGKDTSLLANNLGGGGSAQYLQTRPAYSTRSSISGDDASIYSSMSQDPLAAAIRLNQQVELTEAVADILQRQDLLIRLCKSFIRYGAPSHRIELAMEAMCKTFGVDGSFAFLPGLMMISFGDSDTHTSETHLIKCAQGFDMGRLAKVHKIARALVNRDVQPAEALVALKAINGEKSPYNMWIMLASFAGSSGFIAPLVFRGSWYDMLVSMALGTVVGLTTLLASRYTAYSSVFEVSTSILIAFVAKALRDYVCFTGVVLSSIVMLLPGLSLTTSIMELSSRYMISGSVRMFYSLMYCLFLGFGLSIGSNLWDVFREPAPGELRMGYCHPATEPWRWILFPMLGISLSIQLYASPRQWPVMIVCSSVGYTVSELGGLYWPHALHIAAAVSAFVVGLLGNVYERLTHELAFVPILGSILLIVPGGMGVRSTLLLLDESGNASQGTAFALQMILVALGIAVGLFASTLVVYPLGKKRNALLTF